MAPVVTLQLEHVDRLPVATDDQVLGGGVEPHGVDAGEVAAPPELVQLGRSVLIGGNVEHPDDGAWWWKIILIFLFLCFTACISLYKNKS